MKILVFLLFLITSYTFAQSPAQYNRQGLKQLQKLNLEKAEYYFRKALLLEPGDHVANYNLACVLALKLKGNFCEFQDTVPDIYGYLSNAVRENPGYKTKVLTDPDFEILKSRIGFYESLGYDLKKKSDASMILPRVEWYGPVLGVYGPGDGMDFQISGKLVYWYLDSHRLAYDEIKKNLITGFYYWKGNRLVIRFKNRLPKGRKDYYGELKDHKLFIHGLHEFTDNSFPCSSE